MSAETQVLPAGLDRDDLAALRLADSVVFHHGPDGETRVRALIRMSFGGPPRFLSAREQRAFHLADHRGGDERYRDLAVVRSKMYGFTTDGGRAWNGEDSPQARGFHMIHGAQHEQPWITIANLLRTGDRLGLLWRADNNTDVIRQAGLHVDELVLEVWRGAKSVWLSFTLETAVRLDNSARMIRRHG